MLIVGTKNKIEEVIAIQQTCMNITSSFDSTHIAEFNFGFALFSKHRCSSVGVTVEGTELVTWKLYSVWKQITTPEDLSVLLKFYPSLIHIEPMQQLNISFLWPKPHIVQWSQGPLGLSLCYSHYSWNRGHWSLGEQEVLVEQSQFVKCAELFEIPHVVMSKYQSDWLTKPWVLF